MSSMIHSASSSEHCFHFVLFLQDFEKRGRTDNMCESNDPYQPWLWVGRVDQYYCVRVRKNDSQLKKKKLTGHCAVICPLWSTHNLFRLFVLIAFLYLSYPSSVFPSKSAMKRTRNKLPPLPSSSSSFYFAALHISFFVEKKEA